MNYEYDSSYLHEQSDDCTSVNCDDLNETKFFQSLKIRKRNKMLRTKWRTCSLEFSLVIVNIVIFNLCSIYCDNIPQEVYNFDPSWYHTPSSNTTPVRFNNAEISNSNRSGGPPRIQVDIYSRPNSSLNDGLRRPVEERFRPGNDLSSKPNDGFVPNDRRTGQGFVNNGRPFDEFGRPLGFGGFNKDLPPLYDVNPRPVDPNYLGRPVAPHRPVEPNYGNITPIYPEVNQPNIAYNNEVEKPLDTHDTSFNNQNPHSLDENNPSNNLYKPGLTQHPGGIIANKVSRLEKHFSPYLIKNDIIVEATGELVIEPGVEIRFAPTVGISVRGVLTAKVRVHSFMGTTC